MITAAESPRDTQSAHPGPDRTSAEVPAGRSSFARLGLETRDVLIVTLGVLFVVAYGPFFWVPHWTPRALLLLTALPFGVYELIRLARSLDRSALAALVLLGWAIITSLLSDAPWVSLLPATERDDGAWVIAGALGCWALGRTLTSPGRRAFGLAFVAACAVNGVVGVLQVVLDIQGGPLGVVSQRANGLSTNPVYFGATTAGAVAWCAWVFGSRAGSKRSRLTLAGVACGSCFITMSGSRVALAALLIFIAAAIVKYRTRRSLLLLPSLAVGSILGTALQRSVGGAGSSATDRIGGGGLGSRLEAWKFGWHAFLDRPLTGYGLGRFRPAVQRFFDAEFVSVQQRDDLLEAWFESHNIIVQVTVGIGLVGVLILVVFVAYALRSARGPLLWAAGAIAITWLLQPARLVTLPLAALLLGASQPGLRSVAGEGRRIATRVISSAVVLVSLLIAVWVVMADQRIREATSNPSLAAAERAVAWSPWDPLIANEVATLMFDPAAADPRVTERVLAWSEKAAALEPDFPYWWMRLGIRQMVFEDLDVARVSFERAIDLQPYHPISLEMLRRIAIEQGDDELLRLVNERLEELGF